HLGQSHSLKSARVRIHSPVAQRDGDWAVKSWQQGVQTRILDFSYSLILEVNMFGSAKSKSPSLTDTVSDAAEQVRHWAEDVWQDSADRAAPVVDAASKVLSDTANKVGDAASDFQGKLRSEERRVGKVSGDRNVTGVQTCALPI